MLLFIYNHITIYKSSMPMPKNQQSSIESTDNAPKQTKMKSTPKKSKRNTDKEAMKSAKNDVADNIDHILLEDIYDFAAPNPENTGNLVGVSAQNSVGIYRKIALSFIVLTFILLSTVVFFLLSKTIITIEVEPEIATIEFKTTVGNGNEVSQGIVKDFSSSYSEIYNATGKEIISSAVVGKVKIINNYSQSQPLVAKTRLMAPDGKLFRLKNTISVPAGGSIEADIYADETDSQMAIGPTRFTIPGLWSGLQDKIYAQNEQPFVYKEAAKVFITQQDIDNAIQEAKKTLALKIEDEIKLTYGNYDQLAYNINPESFTHTTEAKASNTSESFEISMSGTAQIAAFTRADLNDKITTLFAEKIGDGKNIREVLYDESQWTTQNVNTENQTAEINALISARVSIDVNNLIVKNKIVGFSEQELMSYLDSLPFIRKYSIEFKPTFIKKVPTLTDRIQIVLIED